MESSVCTRSSTSFAKLSALSLLTMHFLSGAVAALSTAQITLGDQAESRIAYAVKETHFVPNRWTRVGAPDPGHLIDLKIAMRNMRFDELERTLYEVSDPAHERYGKYLSRAEVENLIQPTSEASELVDEWLQDHGILPEHREYSSGKQYISITLSVQQVEELLDTKYAIYEHEEGDRMVRTTAWSLPQHLHDFVATIQPTTAFMRASPHLPTYKRLPPAYDVPIAQIDTAAVGGDIDAACNFSLVTPQCLRTLYKTIDYTPQAPAENQVAFTNYITQVTNRNDTATFLQKFRTEAVSGAYAYKEISIAGGPVDDGTLPGGVEALLDEQTIIGQTFPINVTAFSTGGSPPFQPDLNTPVNSNEPYLAWVDYVRGQEFIPQTVSTSYGDDEQSVPFSYAVAVCQGFAELGVRGVTVLFSSGDNGVGTDGVCVSNDGKNTSKFLPEFPSSCPYVTSVGATRDYPEIVAYDDRNGYVSGAGFSEYFKRPHYQKKVVKKYIKSLNGQFKQLYNKAGRAYPDLAAQGYRYAVVTRGRVAAVDGTSASCPTTASIIALVNDALVAAGRPTLGFLNPLLYSGLGKKAFNDVVKGTTDGCNTTGFAAAKGWDVASGWGTPDFLKILKYLDLEV